MKTHNRHAQALATAAAMLAGFVDAVAFISMGGFFVSFMSGNTTRLGVGLADGAGSAAVAGGLIATFVFGVVLGSSCGRLAGAHRRAAVLALVAVLLAAAATLSATGGTMLAAGAMALAMGAENAVFEVDGEIRIGLTYMTGTLVKLGQSIAAALLGGDRLSWLPYLLLWLGLATGGLLGALAYVQIGSGGLWIAASAAAVLALAAGRSSAAP